MYNDMDYCVKEGKNVFEGLRTSVQFKNSITTALRSGTLSHALILEGADKATRLLAAKEIAMAVLCEGEEKPCRSCNKCKKVEAGYHPDVHILTKDEKSNMIKVEPIRELKKAAGVLPNDGQKSVFIIDSAELMNPQAQNALLKIFEEPAKHLLFILCCGAKSSLLDTIISRATAYSLGEEVYSDDDNEKYSMGLSLAGELALCFAKENELSFLTKIAPLQKDKELFRYTLKGMQLIFRDCFTFQHGGKEALSDFSDTAKLLSTRLTAKKTLEITKALQELYENSTRNSNQNLTLTRFCSLIYGIKSH